MSNGITNLEIDIEFNPGNSPTVTMWNRVEGRPRKNDFNRALRAEIRDPLWMLTKQWQTGEFEGDDAGSPILAKVLMHKERFNKYKSANGDAENYNNDIPLEGLVEQLPLPFVYDDKDALLDLRIMMGRYWLKLINADKSLSDQYAVAYPIQAPESSDNDDIILAHPEAWQKFAAAAQRRMDGYELYKKLKEGISESEDISESVRNEDREAISDYGTKFINWVENFFLEPSDPEKSAYLPSRLEYQFKCTTPDGDKDKIFEAEEYYSGKLDWFNLSIDDDAEPINVTSDAESDTEASLEDSKVNKDLFQKEGFTFIPVNIDYDGMPDTRWWKFEDRNTYLGDIKPDTTDISKLLFLEFSLLYANDWFLIPQKLPAASISNIKGLVVTNCFGERTWIEPTGKGQDDDWNRWTMFTINRKGKDLKEADNSLILLPTVAKIQESEPTEQLIMIRDEIANMVWGIETEISLLSGDRKKGIEAARELKAFYNRLQPEIINQKPESLAAIRYQIMNSVPENWIPFIPVHLEGNREINLQRASMPRIELDDEGKTKYVPIKPRTSLLRHGLESGQSYFIFEEEIPRAGIKISKSYQRTRWYGGKVFKWLGIHKKTGRGEGNSGLAFDRLVPIK